MTRRYGSAARLCVMAMGVCLGLAASALRAEESKAVKSYYIGNSLTAGTAPEFHNALAKGKGQVWDARMFGVAGGRLQQYVDLLFPKYPDMAMPEPGNDRAKQNALATRKAIEGEKLNAVVIQPHQARLVGELGFLKPPRDGSDIAEGSKMVKWVAQHQPDAQIYLYQTWTVPALKDGKNQEDPNWATFDYEKFWLRPYADPAPADDVNPTYNMRVRDYHKKLLDALNENHKDILGARPIRQIPIGDVMLELSRLMKTGKLVGADGKPLMVTHRTVIVDNEKDKNMVDIKTEQIPLNDIGLFYQDFQHQNPGLPRYFDAAVFYAVLFGEKPVGLDYAKYNIFPSKKADGTFDLTSSYNWKANDNRKFIEITPELANAIAEVIWDVVSKHPETGLAK